MLRARRLGALTFPLRRTGSEAGEYVISIGRKEIAECRPSQPRTCRPGPAAQHLSRAEPWLRIVAVGIWRKSWKWREVRAGPFPNIANHLPATKGALAARASRNICRAVEGKVQIRMMAARCGIAPRPPPFHTRKTAAVRIRLTDRRRFPFGLGRRCRASSPSTGQMTDRRSGGVFALELHAAGLPIPRRSRHSSAALTLFDP